MVCPTLDAFISIKSAYLRQVSCRRDFVVRGIRIQRDTGEKNANDEQSKYFLEPPKYRLDDVNEDEVASLTVKRAQLQAYYDQFPDVDQVVDQNNPEILKAVHFTRSVLATKPTGDVNDKVTLCHVLHGMLGTESGECLLFDSSQGTKLHDACSNLVDLTSAARPFVLKLKNIDGLGNQDIGQG